MQWHPLFANMLRPVVRDYYDVETNLPVGDAPRSADIVLGKVALAPGSISCALAPTTYIWLTELAIGGLTQPSLLAVVLHAPKLRVL